MSVRGMRAGRESDFLVGALERNVEPRKESVDIWKVKRTKVEERELEEAAREVYNHRECRWGKNLQQMKDLPSLQSEGRYAAGSWELDSNECSSFVLLLNKDL